MFKLTFLAPSSTILRIRLVSKRRAAPRTEKKLGEIPVRMMKVVVIESTGILELSESDPRGVEPAPRGAHEPG